MKSNVECGYIGLETICRHVVEQFNTVAKISSSSKQRQHHCACFLPEFRVQPVNRFAVSVQVKASISLVSTGNPRFA